MVMSRLTPPTHAYRSVLRPWTSMTNKIRMSVSGVLYSLTRACPRPGPHHLPCRHGPAGHYGMTSLESKYIDDSLPARQLLWLGAVFRL